MKKKQIEIIATAFLILIFILVAASSCKKIKANEKPLQKDAINQVLQEESAEIILKAKNSSLKIKNEKLEKDWGRDPFSGVVYSARGKDLTLKFSGVLWDDKNPQALINGQIVQKNDFIGQYRVVQINKDSVILNDGLKDLELRLGQ